MITKEMKVELWLLALCVVIAIVIGCSEEKAKPIDPERQRIEHINKIDSTTLRTVLNPDTIAGAEKLDALTAEFWMLLEDSTGLVISERNADSTACMASITKMMTCLLAVENGNMNDTIQITPDVFVAKDSRVKLGDGYVMRDLIDEMMLVSDNDAAYALAKHIGGDTLKFCEMMNDKAISIGLGHTHFANPNGMPNLDNYSTACDLVKLSRYCMRDSLFAQIVGTQEKDIPLTDGRHMPCRNTNALLTTYEGCLGIKTGFTRQAGNCLASVATRDGITLYLVLLNSRSMSTRFTESAILLDYGFEVMKAYRRSTLGGSSLK